LAAAAPPPPVVALAAIFPDTAITAKPPARTHDRTPTFRFRSTTAGASFQCKLDNSPYKPCRSPFTTKTLTFGSHLLRVRALAAGASDPSPARLSFKVVKG